MYFQIVYILDQVRALEKEMLLRIQQQGLDFKPKILIVSVFMLISVHFFNYITLIAVDSPSFCNTFSINS